MFFILWLLEIRRSELYLASELKSVGVVFGIHEVPYSAKYSKKMSVWCLKALPRNSGNVQLIFKTQNPFSKMMIIFSHLTRYYGRIYINISEVLSKMSASN